MSEQSFTEVVRPLVHKYRSNSTTGLTLQISAESARTVADTLEAVAERADTWREIAENWQALEAKLWKLFRQFWFFAFVAGFGAGLVVAAIMEATHA